MLRRFYLLREEINLFLDMKEYPFSGFDDKKWIYDFGFCIGIIQHLNDLNISLQGPNTLINEMFD